MSLVWLTVPHRSLPVPACEWTIKEIACKFRPRVVDSLTSLPWESVDLVTKRFPCTKSEPFIASLLLHFLLGDDVEEGWLAGWEYGKWRRWNEILLFAE